MNHVVCNFVPQSVLLGWVVKCDVTKVGVVGVVSVADVEVFKNSISSCIFGRGNGLT